MLLVLGPNIWPLGVVAEMLFACVTSIVASQDVTYAAFYLAIVSHFCVGSFLQLRQQQMQHTASQNVLWRTFIAMQTITKNKI